jgi:hypothetical protein
MLGETLEFSRDLLALLSSQIHDNSPWGGW